MKKILLIFIILFISVILHSCSGKTGASDVTQDIEVKKFMNVNIIGFDEYSKICSEKEITSEKIMGNLYYNGNPIPYDSHDVIYYITLSNKEEWDTGNITHSESGTHIGFIENDILDMTKTDAIKSGKRYKLLAYNTENYMLYNVVFTNMPVMTIDNSKGVLDYENPISSTDTAAKMTLTDAAGMVESDIIIKIRGGSSRAFPKLSYKMNLVSETGQNNLNLLGMREDDDWVLLAVYTDESKIRDKLSYDIWSEFAAENNDFGIHNGAQMKYIELVLNGRYWGLYGLVVPVDKKQQNISDKKGEILCKIESWEIPSSKKLRRSNNAGTVDSIVMKHPQEPNQDSWNAVADLVELVYESDDREFADKIADTADIDNILDYWIMVNVMSGEDNSWKNMYITFKQLNGRYKAVICPWDCDLSWGVTWNADAPLFWEYDEQKLTTMIGAGDLPNRVINNDINGARSTLQKRWNQLRKSILSDDALISRVDELTDEIKNSGAWDRETGRWPSGGHVSDDNLYIKQFIKKRMAFLDKYIAELNR